jgi:hypothetical protein
MLGICYVSEEQTVSNDLPEWLPSWLKEALAEPTVDVPVVGKALYGADRGQSYALARRGVIPTIGGSRRKRVPGNWVRKQLMLDDDPAKPSSPEAA